MQFTVRFFNCNVAKFYKVAANFYVEQAALWSMQFQKPWQLAKSNIPHRFQVPLHCTEQPAAIAACPEPDSLG